MKGVAYEIKGKVICLILCIILLAELPVAALAENERMFLNTDVDFIRTSADGSYYMVYHDDNDNNEIIVPVGKRDINISDINEINEFISNTEVSYEVKAYIYQLYQQTQNDEIEDSTIASVYSPELVDNNRSTSYYTYNGMEMKNEVVSVNNIATGYRFVRGTGAKAAASAVYQILLYLGGSYSSAISLGGTLLSIFEAAVGGSVVSTSSNDFTQVNIKYNDIKQWTYGKLDGIDWYLGYCSERTTITTIEEYQQFIVNGTGTQKRTYKYPNQMIQSSSFSSPWATAYTYLSNTKIEWTSYKIYSSTYLF